MSIAVFPWAALLLAQALAPADKNPHTSPADITHGKKLYAGRCAGCHGPSGDGGKGANLAVPVLPRAADDASLFQIISAGIPDSEMPRQMLTPREVWQVAAYVRTLASAGGTRVSGDPARGRELLRGKGGCLACHSIGGEGGHTGPALNRIGERRSASWLYSKLVEPTSDVSPDFRTVSLTTRAGQKLSGLRLNEDTWSVQMRDPAGRLHSFWKHEVAELKHDRITSMPSYRGRLGEHELNDIVAYLSGLRGAE